VCEYVYLVMTPLVLGIGENLVSVSFEATLLILLCHLNCLSASFLSCPKFVLEHLSKVTITGRYCRYVIKCLRKRNVK